MEGKGRGGEWRGRGVVSGGGVGGEGVNEVGKVEGMRGMGSKASRDEYESKKGYGVGEEDREGEEDEEGKEY